MISPLLADVAPDNIKTWLECLAWLVGFVAGCVGIYSMLKKPDGTPQPLVIEANKQYATQAEHEALAKKMDDELGRERGARKQIHIEIAELQTSTAVLRKETEQQTRQLHQLDGKMDRVLERLPRS